MKKGEDCPARGLRGGRGLCDEGQLSLGRGHEEPRKVQGRGRHGLLAQICLGTAVCQAEWGRIGGSSEGKGGLGAEGLAVAPGGTSWGGQRVRGCWGCWRRGLGSPLRSHTGMHGNVCAHACVCPCGILSTWGQSLTLVTISNIGIRTNLMNPIWAVALVTLSRSMKGATGRPSDFSRSLCGVQGAGRSIREETPAVPRRTLETQGSGRVPGPHPTRLLC